MALSVIAILDIDLQFLASIKPHTPVNRPKLEIAILNKIRKILLRTPGGIIEVEFAALFGQKKVKQMKPVTVTSQTATPRIKLIAGNLFFISITYNARHNRRESAQRF